MRDAWTMRLPLPYRDEPALARALAQRTPSSFDWPAVVRHATPWVKAVREQPAPFWALESLMREYPISSAEGLALMRLAEALLRVPDAETAIALTADQLGRADFDPAASHSVMAGLSASAIAMSKLFLPEGDDPPGLMRKLGAKTVVTATVRAVQLLGRQFVLGRNIQEAQAEAHQQRRVHARLVHSYDMLGEGARTEDDAVRYWRAYHGAVQALAADPSRRFEHPWRADGISIKLSAIFSRYQVAQRERVFEVLLPRVLSLVDAAAVANMNLTIDAEESERLELSLDVFEALAHHVRERHATWGGLGLAVQAYQTRAVEVVDAVASIARATGLNIMVRLVKGAYWDAEIKRAQEEGLPGYPVFTHKHHTDVSYLACAKQLIDHRDVIYPQFATHNAATIAAVLQLARGVGAPFELQRLHGMGEGVYREVLKDPSVACRVYAPVGEHRDLLAYLVRRLLENGANSSFVHQLSDETVSAERLLAAPFATEAAPGLVLPRQLYAGARLNALGMDLQCPSMLAPFQRALASARVEPMAETSLDDVPAIMRRLHDGAAAWAALGVGERAAVLERAADALEADMPRFCAWIVLEGRRVLADAVSEVREAVDFCRYYAAQARAMQAVAEQKPLGVVVCISPWNFPLAIFAGQVVAALVVGNAVAAKPAEQTPYVAQRFVALLHAAGVPRDALALLHGAGETVGAALVSHAHTAGVCFTGSTPVAKAIERSLAMREGADHPLPLVAETGGINAMIVDSTALPEQVVDAVVQSAFRSCGQRCSALRLMVVHASIAESVLTMLAGAMQELVVGDAARIDTDVGPVIDDEAHRQLARSVAKLEREARLIARTPLGKASASADGTASSQVSGPSSGWHSALMAPVAFEIERIESMREEVFGPVLHVVRWTGDVGDVVARINALGYGLTLGVQTRIDTRAERIANLARVGNVYVNRNMVGAVVGVQPFGGEGLSGTGPKAGGPNYLARLVRLQVARVERGGATRHGTADATTVVEASLRASLGWLERLGEAPLAQNLAEHLFERELAGPTGERNLLRLRARGEVGLLVDATAGPAWQATIDATLRQGLVALGVGNTLVVAVVQTSDGTTNDKASSMVAIAIDAWRRAGLDAQRVSVIPLDDASHAAVIHALASRPMLRALVVPKHTVPTAARALAERHGALVRLIVEDLEQAPWLVGCEQVVSTNTAAAGGNAALLAGGA